MSTHEPFRDIYERYRSALGLALTGGGETCVAVALECQDELDATWDRVSRALPPLSPLARVRLTSRRGHFLLHAVGRQAVWREESFEVANDALALASGAP